MLLETTTMSSKANTSEQAIEYFTDFMGIGLDPTAVVRRLTFDKSSGEVIQDLHDVSKKIGARQSISNFGSES